MFNFLSYSNLKGQQGNDLSNFIKFYRLNLHHKFLLLEALVCLGIFEIIISTVKFKRIASRLGKHMHESCEASNALEMRVIKDVSWAVTTMSRHNFWESKCLVQAITAKCMLRRRNINSTLYLGVARDERQTMIAHAWLRSGKTIVTGAKVKEAFVSLSSFADID